MVVWGNGGTVDGAAQGLPGVADPVYRGTWSYLFSRDKMSPRLNLRSRRGPTRWALITPCSVHPLRVLLWTFRRRLASLIVRRSVRESSLPIPITPHPFRVLCSP